MKLKISPFFTGRKKQLLLIAMGFLLLGYFLMIVKSSPKALVNSKDIFTFVHITLAPILVLMGYGLIITSIMIKPNK
ncbi:MAG: DUF3098 domain-containing protein [Bacteroidota bacterium]